MSFVREELLPSYREVTYSITLDYRHIKEALSVFLHTIFFYRTMGCVNPKDVRCDGLAFTYVECGCTVQNEAVDSAITSFIKELSGQVSGHICLNFQTKEKGLRNDPRVWERWFLNVKIVAGTEAEEIEACLRDFVFSNKFITDLHMPDLEDERYADQSYQETPYYFKITVHTPKTDKYATLGRTIGNMFRNIF